MQLETMEKSLEAVLFAAGDPVEVGRIAVAFETEEKTVRLLAERIRDRYRASESPFEIATLGDCLQMCTLPQYSSAIRGVLELRRSAVLSQAALEVLAIIAYNQPATRAFVEQVRGVDCSNLLRSLMDKELIEEAGRLSIPGRPIAYATTPNFLRCFALESLDDLPTAEQLAEQEDLSNESPGELLGEQLELFMEP